VIFYCS